MSSKVIMVRDTSPYGHAPTYQISLTYLEKQKWYGPDKKILFKNNYFTLMSKIKVPRRSLRYVTHRLMVMHPHTKWIIFKNNNLTLRSKFKVPRRSLRYVTHHLMVMHPHTKYHWHISNEKNVMARTRKYYLKAIILPWGQRSRSHEDHYGIRHIALWSCTHIPNIIDRSGKTKTLWFVQASLRRSRRSRSGSGRKNQTKTICLPSFEGET